jgi:tetratricopeptide (TPR) repeat protein
MTFFLVCLLNSTVVASQEKQLFETGIGHLKQHRYEAAVNVFTELIETDPDNPDVYKNRGVAYMKLSRYDPAIQDFEKTKQLAPDLKGLHSNLGVAWYYKGEYRKAIENYDQEISLFPDSYYVYFNRAISWAELKEDEKSLEDIAKTLALSPDFYLAHCLKGDIYLEQGDTEAARAAYEKAVTVDPEAAYAREQLEKLSPATVDRTPEEKRPDPEYEIQTGAFQVQENAQNQLTKLKGLGYDARILTLTRSNNVTWYLVRTGTFFDRKAAEQAMAEFSSKTGMKAYVRPWNQF